MAMEVVRIINNTQLSGHMVVEAKPSDKWSLTFYVSEALAIPKPSIREVNVDRTYRSKVGDPVLLQLGRLYEQHS